MALEKIFREEELVVGASYSVSMDDVVEPAPYDGRGKNGLHSFLYETSIDGKWIIEKIEGKIEFDKGIIILEAEHSEPFSEETEKYQKRSHLTKTYRKEENDSE